VQIDKPGIYALPVPAYHLDPAPEPSMSASGADLMLNQSARHCWHNHPRLNPLFEPEAVDPDKMESGKRLRMEWGSALHTMILGAGRKIVEIDGEEYRTNRAREARAAATAAGFVPILASHTPKLLNIVAAVKAQLRGELAEVLAAPGRAEQTLVWRERIGFLWCRALADWMPDDPSLPLIDWKFTTTSAAPESYARSVRADLSLRTAHYLRGAQALRGRAPRAYWICAVEMAAPHGLSVHRADGALLHDGRDQWTEAAARFAACLRRGTDAEHWPFWSQAVNAVGAPPWQASAWEERKHLESIPASRGQITVRRVQQLQKQLGGPVA
jgi:hypothetical protein